MPTCKLCNKRDANKTGSHLISDFILRSMLVEGNPSRRSDRIISNRIETLGTDLFVGRDVNQEKVNELLDRDLSDEDLANNINHYTVDNLLCTVCEDRLSYLETIFKTDIYDKLDALPIQDNKIVLDSEVTCVFKLFWLSVIWRCSIANFGTFKIDNKSENRIRKIINDSLGESIEETRKLIQENCPQINSETIGVLYVKEVDDYLKNLVFCSPFLKMPYVLVINDFYIFFYSKSGHVNAMNQTMFKLDNEFKKDNYINKKNCKSIQIGVVKAEKFKESRDYIYGLKAKDLLDKAVALHNDTFNLATGTKPTGKVIGNFVDALVNEEGVNMHDRYKEDRILRKIKENIVNTIAK
ncbi:hypothetical protein [Carboxylicivirga linearis]|uniref:Uncharacterized protein n=1 Tax=Carboxylicivirga linearis TaxID=1628157 RepID=A0ABS5K1S4_9BACT|nr:hypothetical protein [Carboxylicivirga linearis]MBS2101084.1 hypothetical protein [Carboxylicivirga linearis]